MFKYILKKEFLLISRDIHALMVLFIMPAIFILIMSLALKNTYSDNIETKLKVAVISSENIDITNFIKDLNKSVYFSANLIDKDSYKTLIYEKDYDFLIEMDKDFKNKINSNDKTFEINSFSSANISKEHFYIFKKYNC